MISWRTHPSLERERKIICRVFTSIIKAGFHMIADRNKVCDRLRSCDRDRRRSQKIEPCSISCDRLRSNAIVCDLRSAICDPRSYGNQPLDRTWFYLLRSSAITIAGSQTIADLIAICDHMETSLKTCHKKISRPSRAVTAKKCTKKFNSRAELLFWFQNLLLF